MKNLLPKEFELKLFEDVIASGPGGSEKDREFFIDNLLIRIHFIIVMMRWTSLAPWEFEFPFPGSLTSTSLGASQRLATLDSFHRFHPERQRYHLRANQFPFPGSLTSTFLYQVYLVSLNSLASHAPSC